MLAAERRQLILEQLQIEKTVVVSQLSGLFRVSQETIRRDLDYLCRAGLATKSYGGATITEQDLPFKLRKMQNPSQKQKIAELIGLLINDNESVMLDASTTAVFAANALRKKNNLTIITNSIEVMLELADKPDFKVIASGGNLMGDYLAFTGQRAVSEISSFIADKLIFSCKGLAAEQGIFESNDDFSQIKQAMLRAAKVKILAADLSKFNRTAFSKIAEIAEIDIVVTDSAPGENWLNHLRKLNVECIY